ncbi:alpha/beta hydrolase [Labrys neptuniae]|uniref:alpha/beta hydrolase n=1 Tax=Labrys neptuniae TaxID=376174 RepID=UPI00288D0D3A|nr:alpha/beta hydrolase [Labrys neptuniae]MDT3376890.1 alpha/beta hydrolase [Labrys neptuniae]
MADFDDIVCDMVRRSEATRAAIPMSADIAYGHGPDETIDLFFPPGRRRGLPVHMFVHGGYWRMFSKRDYSYVADTVTKAGAIAVIVDYALMPAVRMAVIVEQLRRAKQWVIENIASYGGNPSQLTISGHSAGAHLSTFLFNQTQSSSGIRAALLLGGIFDLKPLQSSFLHPEIGITDTEVEEFSPLGHRHDPHTYVDILVGAEETPPFHLQAGNFAIELRRQGLSVSRRQLPRRNHMSSVRDLGTTGSAAYERLSRLIGTERH